MVHSGSFYSLYYVKKRIWPFGDLFGVFSDEIILTENEQRAVDSEAVLAYGNGIVEGHSPGSLRHRLLVHSLGPGPAGWTVPVSMSVSVYVAMTVSVGASLPAATPTTGAPAAGPSAIPGGYLVSEPCHSLDPESQSSRSSGEGDQCSAVQPHNITSHPDQNVSCTTGGLASLC